MIIIGIDPGKHTGMAYWNTESKKLLRVEEMLIHQVMNSVDLMHHTADLVIFEDARLRTWFGAKGKEALQGAGSIKRDSTIWEDFLIDRKIPFIAAAPRSNKTKLSSDQFKLITGWEGRTNEHARDASMLVFGMTDATVRSLLCNYEVILRESEVARLRSKQPRRSAE